MSAFSAIDLEKLPAPNVVETLDVESILAEMVTTLKAAWPEFSNELESEPAIKLLEVAAYREVLLRARINDASRAVMLAFAIEADLEHIAAQFGVRRQLEEEGDLDAIPPIDPRYESDDRLRQRTQLSLEGHSTAGPVGSYVFHALASDVLVKDVDVFSPSPGEVVVTILSTQDRGEPNLQTLENVDAYLSADTIRPLTDRVTVVSAQVIDYEIVAELFLFDGPDAEVVRQSADDAINVYVNQRHRLGHDIALSGVYAALHQPGVQRVELLQPTENLVIERHQAAWNTRNEIRIGGRDE